MTPLLLSLLAAAGYGVSDFLGGLGARRVAALRVCVVSYPLGLVGMLAVAPLVGGELRPAALLVGAASGLLGGLAILWFYLALAAGPMSVVSPVTAVLVVALPLAVGLLAGERPGPAALVGAGVGVLAVLLVSRSPGEAASRFTRRVALLTVGSGVVFGGYFVLLDAAGPDTGLWPLTASRLTATLTVLAMAAAARQLRPPTGVPLRLAVGCAALDVVANGAFVLALHAGLLSLVSVVTALYPASTVLLARLVLGERTGVVQRAGLALAAVSVALIAGAG